MLFVHNNDAHLYRWVECKHIAVHINISNTAQTIFLINPTKTIILPSFMNGIVKSISLLRCEVIVKSAIARSAIGGWKNEKKIIKK